MVISEAARRHDLRPQQLFAWRHQARQGRLALPADELSFVPDRGRRAVGCVLGRAAGNRDCARRRGRAGPPEVDDKLLAKVLRAVTYKRLDEGKFVWPRVEEGVMRLSLGQLGALFEGLNWKRVHSRRVPRPRPRLAQ